MKIRIIWGSPEGGSLSAGDIAFTADLDTPAAGYLRPGFVVMGDITRDIDLPNSFPSENIFNR